MLIHKPISTGIFKVRYKRFLADILMGDGRLLTVHCPNSGAMTGCAIAGARAYISDSQNPKRKLRHTLEVIETDKVKICVNTHRANALVEEAIRENLIPELGGFTCIRREVRFGRENSRVDLCLEASEGLCFVEVKNVTLSSKNGVVAFPDAVTKRGTKHLRELISVVDDGHRAALVYCVARTDAIAVRPAREIDPDYADTLAEAIRAGVEVYALKISINLPTMRLVKRLPIQLEGD